MISGDAACSRKACIKGGKRQMKIWQQSSQEICDEIRSTTAPLKVVLKTRNEVYLLRKWIDHHLPIVGPHNIIIMDNGSDSDEVLSIYSEFKDEIGVFGFEGGHNFLHVVEQF